MTALMRSRRALTISVTVPMLYTRLESCLSSALALQNRNAVLRQCLCSPFKPLIAAVSTSAADGVASGVFLLNSNGMDIELQEEAITYRVIGGVLDFFFFLGPRPEDVIQQYQEVIGRPAMPPLWALGFHQCRWGYKTLSDVKQVVQGYRKANIPLEVMWADIDYMDRYRDFTFDPQRFNQQELRAVVDSLHAAGQRWVPITDCGIPHAPDDPAYVSGIEAGVFIRDVTGAPYLGQVWPGATHYPDFLAVNPTWAWWAKQLQDMWDKVPYDGMWIDMNEASNFCDGEICWLPEAQAAAADTDARDSAAANDSEWVGRVGSSTRVGNAAATVAKANESGYWPAASLRHGWSQVQQVLYWVWSMLDSKDMRDSPIHRFSFSSSEEVATSASSANCELQCSTPAATDLLSNPPYAINNLQTRVHLGSKALPVTARHVNGELEYDAHNLYGLSEAAATRAALEQITHKRPFVLSRSTFPGSGSHTAHWTGDNAATWDDLLWSVSGLLNSNMWGIPLAGADICGFQGDTNEELCARWIQVGSFYTFTRNHNSINSRPQELYLWPTVAEAGRKALSMRYSLLLYIYTCFYKVHVDGGTVARPLFFSFPADEQARDTYKQWMLGDSLLISPVLSPSTTQISAYFPEGSWYNIWNENYSHIRGPQIATLDIPLTDTAVHLRGGSIIAMQQPGNTTGQTRRSDVKLVVALNQQQAGLPGSPNGESSRSNVPGPPATDGGSTSGVELGCGVLYLDDGDSLEVPPADINDSLLVLLSSMSLLSGQQGYVSSTLADQKVGDADAGVLYGDNLVSNQQHCQQQGAWVHRASNDRAKAKSKYSAGPGWPQLSEVVVLGVPPPAAPASPVSAVESAGFGSPALLQGSGSVRYTIRVNGEQLADEQVEYSSDSFLLRIKGLQVMLANDIKLEWQSTAAKEQ